jgi:AraC-like DNA-binding protein
MKPASSKKRQSAQREIITGYEGQLFSFKADTDMWTTWHYHPEIDILLTLKNTGYHTTGDYIGELRPGTLLLNGPNVPHAFHPNELPEGDSEKPAMYVIQFSKQSLGKEFLGKLEMDRIRSFLESVGRSFEFFGKPRQIVEDLMRAMIIQNEAQRLASFILILDALASASKSERQSLVSEMYAPSLSEETVRRIDQVRNWIITHLESQIRLEEVAFEAGMSPKSFSRFFKKNTGMTFIQYVNELRIGVACRRLVQSEASVSEICYASGFNNLSNFNRQFRERKGIAPKEFRKQFLAERVT